MKKILSRLLLFSMVTTFCINAVACTGYDFNGGGINPTPSPPIPKDIKYYQKLMQDCQNIINDFTNNINELTKYQNDKNIFPTPGDYARIINELKAEQASYQATVYDCQYQILYLQTNGNFNPKEKSQAIIYLQQELIQLNNELVTKKQYASDYDKNELETIQTSISSIQNILKTLLK